MTNKAPSLKILIRADASPAIGSGHVMRSLTLAHALKKAGADVTFASRTYLDNKNDYIRSSGFSVKPLKVNKEPDTGNDYLSWLGDSCENDAKESLGQDIWDVVIADHYGADYEWQNIVRSRRMPLVVLDDGVHQQITADIILNANLGFERSYASVENCKLLLGPSFALIKDNIRIRREPKRIRSELNHILISMGGYDAQGICYKIASHIPDSFQITVLAGANNPQIKALNALKSRKNIHVLEFTEDVGRLIAEADFCFGAGGSSIWERCCLGLPSALFYLADNQKDIVQNLYARDACFNLGAASEYDFNKIEHFLGALIKSGNSQLQEMSHRVYELVDGKGTARIVDEIYKLTGRDIESTGEY